MRTMADGTDAPRRASFAGGGGGSGLARRQAAMRVRELLISGPRRVPGYRALGLVVDLLGDRARVHVADQYLYDYARSQGYYLPPYPLAGCGELRGFLADQGVRDIPSWYATIGVDAGLYAQLYRYDLLVAMDDRWWRQAIPLDARWREGGGAGCDDDELTALAIYLVGFVCGDDRRVRTVLFR